MAADIEASHGRTPGYAQWLVRLKPDTTYAQRWSSGPDIGRKSHCVPDMGPTTVGLPPTNKPSVTIVAKTRRKAPAFPPLQESPDQREERETRIAELIERARRHQRRAEEHQQEAERLKTQGPSDLSRKGR
jgi:hypothetical protein